MHLRHSEGFSQQRFEEFCGGCRVWQAYVQAVLREGLHDMGTVSYQVGEPSLSADRRVATLPLWGAQTVGSRAAFEDSASYLLREFLPIHFVLGLEEGLEEDLGGSGGHGTNWRMALVPDP